VTPVGRAVVPSPDTTGLPVARAVGLAEPSRASVDPTQGGRRLTGALPGALPVWARGDLLLAVATATAAAGSFLFHALAGRRLEPADYSSLGAVLAVLLAAAVPLGALQTAVTAGTARARRPGDRLSGRRVLVLAGVGSVLLALATTTVTPLLAGVLRLPSVAPLVVAVVWLALNGPASVLRGLLLGAGHAAAVAASLVVAAAVRLVLLVALTPQAAVVGAVAATAGGELAGGLVVLVAAHRSTLLGRSGGQSRAVRARPADARRALGVQVLVWVFAGAGPVLARRALPGADQGSFTAMATTASACLFLPQAVALASLPRFVADGSARRLGSALAVAATLAAVAAVPLCALAGPVFGVLYGDAFRPDRAVLVLLCLQACGLGLLAVLAQFAVARGRGTGLAVPFGLVAAVVLAETAVSTPVALAAVLAVTIWPAVALSAARVLHRPGGSA
jgi:O-antigen/teichoic acid export membrane protein